MGREPEQTQEPNIDTAYLRRKRLLDAGKVVPFLGLFLIMLPLVWPETGSDGEVATSAAIQYLFACWVLLIIAAAFFSYRVARLSDSDEETE